jgi:23S rRNA pseudouridine1911/1915/1917 synthase
MVPDLLSPSQTPSQKTRLAVFPADAGLRLDLFLAAATTRSRRQLRRDIADGLVWRNGQPVRVASRQLEFGDIVDLLLPPEATGAPATPAVESLEIIHRDSWLIVVDKPSGLLSQPAEVRQPGELAADETLCLQLAIEAGSPPFLRLVHRLDRPTSGLLLFAGRPEALPRLAKAWSSGQVHRSYLAVVEGAPLWQQQTLSGAIARDRSVAWRFEVSPEGRPAETEVRVLGHEAGLTQIECRLKTGRTHQVRVHLAHAGFPVAGDVLYGGHREVAARPLLHAAGLVLPHPKDGSALTLRAPLPPDFPPC